MWKIVAFIFGFIGFLLFILSTGFFTNWSETGLVNGSYGFFFGLFGGLGAYLGRDSALKTIFYSIAMAIIAIIILSTFYSVIWPML